jgi:5,6,7,8-tetrahydromethanopterin hydro-lyase
MPKITKVGVGEALVGDGNEVAHIDLVVGPRGSPAEVTFYRVLTSQREGVNGLLALIALNLPARPHTVMFNKVTIKGAKQAEQMFGPAQYAVAKAVTDCVKDGTVPLEEADDLFVSVGVFTHWDANDNKKIQQFNYEATKLALRRALEGKPTVNEVIEQEDKSGTLWPYRNERRGWAHPNYGTNSEEICQHRGTGSLQSATPLLQSLDS